MTVLEPSDDSDVSQLRITGIESQTASRVDDVISLGDKHRSTMGHLPFAGYKDSAQRGHIVVALDQRYDDGPAVLAGYCLYDPTVRADRYARVVHLCVAEEYRDRGVAKRLIAAVRERCADRLGLRLRCRDDWDASKIWPSLGFEPIRQLVGRSKKGNLLTEWWSPNEITDLFSLPADDPEQLLVSVDSNVFCDLYGTSKARRQRFSGNVAVLAGSQQIRLARPFSLTTELKRTTDERERGLLLQAAAVHMTTVLNGDKAEVRAIRDGLLAAIPQVVLAKDPSLPSDALLLAESIAGGAEVFVTRDTNAVTYLRPTAFEAHNVVVIDPVELPDYVEQRANAAGYLPVQLEQTLYQVTKGDADMWNPERLVNLLDNEGGERKPDFRKLIRDLAAELPPTRTERLAMLTPAGEVLAIWATRRVVETLEVPLLRVTRGDLLPTITRQIVMHLRRQSVLAGLHTVRVLDNHAHREVAHELRRDSFKPSDDSTADLQATVLRVVGTWSEVQNAAKNAGAAAFSTSWADSTPLRAEAAEYERVWWPAKISDADLPSFIVPIRGVFADDLLAHLPSLLMRDADLGLSREHVYYRSGRNRLPSPGRILWYSSKRDKQVVGCSRLVESLIGTPEALHRVFAHLGVWDLEKVRASADGRGHVNALRFSDTEIFPHPISLSRVRELSGRTVTLTIRSATQIDGQQFACLYEDGVPS